MKDDKKVVKVCEVCKGTRKLTASELIFKGWQAHLPLFNCMYCGGTHVVHGIPTGEKK